MTRLKEQNDLSDMAGKLGTAFRSATLMSLRRAFVAAAHVEESTAQQVLTHFEKAAQRLRLSEHGFRVRARKAEAKPTLLSHLRTPEQFAALRDFAAARENLLNLSPDIGGRIVRHVALATDSPVVASLRPTAPSPQI